MSTGKQGVSCQSKRYSCSTYTKGKTSALNDRKCVSKLHSTMTLNPQNQSTRTADSAGMVRGGGRKRLKSLGAVGGVLVLVPPFVGWGCCCCCLLWAWVLTGGRSPRPLAREGTSASKTDHVDVPLVLSSLRMRFDSAAAPLPGFLPFQAFQAGVG